VKYRAIALVGLVAGVAAGFLTLRSRDEGDSGTNRVAQDSPAPEAPAEARQQQAQSPSEKRLEVSIDAPGGSRTMSASELSARYHRSSDYWEFVDAVTPAAAAGDARAQFLLAEALGECKTAVAGYQRRYPGKTPTQIVDEGLWKTATPGLAAVYVAYLERDFMKCAQFFAGDPPALDALQVGPQAHTRDYWLGMALANDDPIALIQDAYQGAAELDGASAESKPAILDRIEKGVTLAVESADPEALIRLSALVGFVGSTEPTEGPAWTIVACESGYDCSYMNPAIGKGCATLGLCSGGESLTGNMQQDLGPMYGRAYARGQEILEALRRGEGNSVAESVIEKLDLEH
jgi:hypothetical protein